jgi:hypothetical protein
MFTYWVSKGPRAARTEKGRDRTTWEGEFLLSIMLNVSYYW